MFFIFVLNATVCLMGINIFGAKDYFSGNYPPLEKTKRYSESLLDDFWNLTNLASNEIDIAKNEYTVQKNQILDNGVNEYLSKKAAIIESELRYTVENYDSSYFDFEYTADLIEIPEEYYATNVYNENSNSGNTSVPKNIEVAKIILEACEGTEFLQYEALVRPDAFSEINFRHEINTANEQNYSISIIFSCESFNYNEEEIRIEFSEQFDAQRNDIINSILNRNNISAQDLDSRVSLVYYAKNASGIIYANDDKKPDSAQIMENHNAYIIYESNSLTLNGANDTIRKNILSALNANQIEELYLYVSQPTSSFSGDIYTQITTAYSLISDKNVTATVSVALITLCLSVIFLIVLLCLCGKTKEWIGYTTAITDRIPNDIHFILNFGIIAIILHLLFVAFSSANYSFDFGDVIIKNLPIISAFLLTSSYIIFCEWITSTARILKSGNKNFEKMLTAKAAVAFIRLIKNTIKKIKSFFSMFKYKPKKIKRNIFLLFGFYLTLNSFCAVGIALCYTTEQKLISIILIAADIVFNTLTLYFAIKYFSTLDRIIEASSANSQPDFNNSILPSSLAELAQNLTKANKELQDTIKKAVRDEQMKTELITNVSHDLKTPLTSLISYSDLLTKCDVDNEDAKKYIAVINTQSIKLKRLIEDLIEASKASTGNITLNKEILNLSELAIQAIAEFSPEIEAEGNEIVFSQKSSQINVFADGTKTFRIFSNLLSNAKKYSAKGTRIYIDIFTDNINSYFEIKNISAEPLNINPEEITERFVRGDKSRTMDGNGLGLSIAKDLCKLQNGKLTIAIDGDLFKATVALPVNDISEQ